MAGAPQIGEETKVTLDLKTIGMIVTFIIMLAGMWYTLQADIAQAKELPAPVIDRIEYDLKDELIRQTIMDTQEDVEEIKETIDKIDQRLYEIQKNR
jgi:copper chaperone CopZ